MSWLNSQEKLTLVLVEKRILGILFCKKIYCIIAFIAYCNSFLRGQLLHIAIFNSFFSCYCYCYCNSSDGYFQCLGFVHGFRDILPQHWLLLQIVDMIYICRRVSFIVKHNDDFNFCMLIANIHDIRKKSFVLNLML